jgi:hypothetical protein
MLGRAEGAPKLETAEWRPEKATAPSPIFFKNLRRFIFSRSTCSALYAVSKNQKRKSLSQETISASAAIVLLYSFLSRTVLLFNSLHLDTILPSSLRRQPGSLISQSGHGILPKTQIGDLLEQGHVGNQDGWVLTDEGERP